MPLSLPTLADQVGAGCAVLEPLTIMAGAPLMVVAQNLGHRDTRMVERHYGHLAESYVTDMIRKTAPSFGITAGGNVVAMA